MLKHLTLMSFLFLNLSAFADLNGNYQGDVKYTDYNGQQTDVSLDVTLEVTNTSVKISEAQSWLLVTSLDVKDGKLSYNGAECGTITENEIAVKGYTGNQGITYALTLSLKGDDLMVKDMADNNGKTDGLEGTIKKVANFADFHPFRLHSRFMPN